MTTRFLSASPVPVSPNSCCHLLIPMKIRTSSHQERSCSASRHSHLVNSLIDRDACRESILRITRPNPTVAARVRGEMVRATSGFRNFDIVGLLMVTANDFQWPQQYRQSNNNAITRKRWLALVSCSIARLIGPGSAALHASLKVVGLWIDQIMSMFL